MEQTNTDRADLIERLREAREEAAEKTRRWDARDAAPWLYDLVDRAAAELPKPVTKDDRSTVEHYVQELVSYKLDAPEPAAEELDALVLKVKRNALKMRKWRKEGPASMLNAAATVERALYPHKRLEAMLNPLAGFQKSLDQMVNPLAGFQKSLDATLNPLASYQKSLDQMVNPTAALLDGHRKLLDTRPASEQIGLNFVEPELPEFESVELPPLPERPTREDFLEHTAALREVIDALKDQNAANEARHKEQLAASEDANRGARRFGWLGFGVAVLSLVVAVVAL
ncbi:MAG: hypothetical protein J7513_02105 [Solirubrobacteraceae bacterium]|nr:hypothetical protein [Solirubrobacteraceae bacterium]